MARRTTFCPVSENLSVIEPRSITVFHSNLDTSSNHGLKGRSYLVSLPASALNLTIDRFDFRAPVPAPVFPVAPENFERVDLRVSKLSERHLHVKAPQNVRSMVICHWSLV